MQEKCNQPHLSWEEYFNLSQAQYENLLGNNLENEFEGPPINSHKYFNQYAHEENVAVGLQWPHFDYTKTQE